MLLKPHLVITVALMTSWLQANAGPYTDAVKINKFCSTTGMKLGETAYEGGEQFWQSLAESKAEISELEAKIKSAPRDANPPSQDVQVAKLLLPTAKKINEIKRKSETEARAIYITYVTDVYGKYWIKLAQRIWVEASKADSEENAKEVAYAVCMDYFIDK